MAKNVSEMTSGELKNYLADMKMRRIRLQIPLVVIGEYLGFSEGIISKTEDGKGKLRAGLIHEISRMLDDVEAGRLKVRRSNGVSAQYRRFLRLDQSPHAGVIVIPAKKSRTYGQASSIGEDLGDDLGFSVGLVRRNLRISAEQTCSVMDMNRRDLLCKEAGIYIMPLGEAARLLRYYAQCADQILSDRQTLIDFDSPGCPGKSEALE